VSITSPLIPARKHVAASANFLILHLSRSAKELWLS
jgi:hypothetical protein